MAGAARFSPDYSTFEDDFFVKTSFCVIDKLGYGMSSEVHLAQSTAASHYQVAMKILTLSHTGDMKKHYFRNEVFAMKLFNHRNLMKAKSAIETSLRLYIFMEYYPRRTLDMNLRGLDFVKTELFLVQLASAIKHMHDHRFVHIDIKLSNILLEANDRVLLADFGLSFQMSNIHDVVYARHIGGTMIYHPPEKLYADVDAIINPMKLDMYALGVVLKAMIYRLKPEDALNGHQSSVRTVDVPPFLLYCMENLLKENPAERFSSRQLMDVLLQSSRWQLHAMELEAIFVADPGAVHHVLQNLPDTGEPYGLLQICQ